MPWARGHENRNHENAKNPVRIVNGEPVKPAAQISPGGGLGRPPGYGWRCLPLAARCLRPGLWHVTRDEAVAADKILGERETRGLLRFLHRSLVPLRQS
jgi:hypothetical protein